MKEYFNIKNIKRDKPLSYFGYAIILAAVISVFVIPEVDWQDAIYGICLGAFFLPLARKSQIDDQPDGKIYVSTLFIWMLLFWAVFYCSACKSLTYSNCLEKFGSSDTTIIHDTLVIHDTIPVTVPPDSAELNLLIDSLLLLEAGSTVEKTSKDGRTTLTVKKSKDNNRLEIKARCNEVNLTLPVQIIYPYEKQVIKNEYKDKPKGWRKYWNSFKDLSAIMVLAGLILLLIKLVNK